LFSQSGCICKGKSPRRWPVTNAYMAEAWMTFVHRPCRSTRHAAWKLNMPYNSAQNSVGTFDIRSYRHWLSQCASAQNKEVLHTFCCDFLSRLEDDKMFIDKIVSSDEATINLSGTVTWHNLRIWGSNNPYDIAEYVKDNSKLNAFCALSKQKVSGTFFFVERISTGIVYQD
jgi:hypothetical protein